MIKQAKKQLLMAAAMAALGLSASASFAKDIVVDTKGEVPYVIDARNVVARSGTDLCWRTGYWTPAAATNTMAGNLPVGCECDKDVVGADTCVPATARGAAGAPAAAAVAAPAAAAKCDFSVNLSADSTFAFNKATLTASAKATLDNAVIAKLGSCAAVDTLIITGHTDHLGSQGYNQKLSEKRADAVKKALGLLGVSEGQLESVSLGEEKPSCGDASESCWSANRRGDMLYSGEF